jgi:ATP-binding cassette subfamily F protein 3
MYPLGKASENLNKARTLMLQASNIGKQYGDTLLFQNASFTLNARDRVGLVGPNGCGKTTLLRILNGDIRPDSGSVILSPPKLRIGYLEQAFTYQPGTTIDDIIRAEHQKTAEIEQKVERLANQIADAAGQKLDRLLDEYGKAISALERLSQQDVAEHKATAVLDGLDLAHLPLTTPVDILSGGQKTRLSLAQLLIQKPQALLMDEPTNHLDIDALEWLEAWLDTYPGMVVIVSHDRTFLDRTVDQILEIDEVSYGVTLYPGNYTEYLEIKRRELERQWAAYKDQQQRIAQLTQEAGRLSGYASSIERGTIDFGPRKIAKGIARRAVVQRRRIERELAEDRVDKPKPTWHMKLEFEDVPEGGQDVLIMDELAVGYEGTPIVTDISDIVRSGERIALTGPNGSGKTTLLRTLHGEIEPIAGQLRFGTNIRVGYYGQELETLDPESTPFQTIRDIAAMSDTDIRSFLHFFLFSGDEVFTPNDSLSYGERARLVLAQLVASGCNVLILDEPINHLDIPSRSSFEQAMAAFDGTVIAVVHDRYFIKRFATRLWVVRDGGLHTYLDLEDYQRARNRESSKTSEESKDRD